MLNQGLGKKFHGWTLSSLKLLCFLPSAYFCVLPSSSAIPFKWTLVVMTFLSYKIFGLLYTGQRGRRRMQQ